MKNECWLWEQTYALTKPGSLKGVNKSPRRIFDAALTKVTTALELPRELKVLSVRQRKQHAAV